MFKIMSTKRYDYLTRKYELMQEEVKHSQKIYNMMIDNMHRADYRNHGQAQEIRNLNAALVRKTYSNNSLKELLTEAREHLPKKVKEKLLKQRLFNRQKKFSPDQPESD